jgi:triacylglycerol lipase
MFLFLLFLISSVGAYDNNIGLESAKLSAITYCPESEVGNWSCYWCQQFPNFQLINTFWDSKTSTYLSFGKMDNTYIIAYEGSQDLTDWMIDLEISKLIPYKDYPTAKVHYGFWQAYSSIRQELYTTLQKEEITNLFITGHSLGGALSTITSLDIAEELGYPNISMINFGSPRVGNPDYVEIYKQYIKNYYRVTHGSDPIPRLPPTLLGFYHIGNEIYYPNSTLSYISCTESENDQCEDGNNFLPWNSDDHRIYLGIRLSQCF